MYCIQLHSIKSILIARQATTVAQQTTPVAAIGAMRTVCVLGRTQAQTVARMG